MRAFAIAAVLALATTLPARADFPPADRLPSRPGLPDPLVLQSGKKVTTPREWQELRRPELKALFQHYMYGHMPADEPELRGRVLFEEARALGGKATLREVGLALGSAADAPVVHVLLITPNKKAGPAPVFLGLNFAGNHAVVDDERVRVPTSWIYPGQPGVVNNKASAAGRGKQADVWNPEMIIDRGYALATVYNGDLDPDRADRRGGVRPYLAARKESAAPGAETATIAAWAWGLRQVVNYLTRDVKEVDPKRIIVVGHSRLGKTALLAGACDDRIAMAIPSQAGCGGTAPSRGQVGESVKQINDRFPHWFCGNFKQFNDHPDRLPFDQHELVALMAPRPVLLSNAVEDAWANPAGQFEVLKAAEPVYKLLGAGGVEVATLPEPGRLLTSRLGYFIRPGKHSMTAVDWKAFLDFADHHLGQR